MIILGYKKDRNGNTQIIITNDNQTDKFALQTNEGALRTCHYMRGFYIWSITDSQKLEIVREIKTYIYTHGTDRQKRIVFDSGELEAFDGYFNESEREEFLQWSEENG